MGRESVSVFVGNLSDNARNEDVDRFFKGYGKLRDVSLKGGYGEFNNVHKKVIEVRDKPRSFIKFNGGFYQNFDWNLSFNFLYAQIFYFSGFVEFVDEYDAKDAVRDLDGKEICGQKVRIELSNVSFYFSKTYIAYKIQAILTIIVFPLLKFNYLIIYSNFNDVINTKILLNLGFSNDNYHNNHKNLGWTGSTSRKPAIKIQKQRPTP